MVVVAVTVNAELHRYEEEAEDPSSCALAHPPSLDQCSCPCLSVAFDLLFLGRFWLSCGFIPSPSLHTLDQCCPR